jgi:hypothetical protein
VYPSETRIVAASILAAPLAVASPALKADIAKWTKAIHEMTSASTDPS